MCNIFVEGIIKRFLFESKIRDLMKNDHELERDLLVCIVTIDWPQKAMGNNSKESLVKLGSSEERGDHPAALMISEVFAP
jgi:hypothetical protein